MRCKSTALVLVFASSIVSPGATFALEPGDAAGPIKLINSAGLEITLENYKERPATAVLFVSSRCPATEKAIGDINTLYQRHRRKDVLYVGVCANGVETPEELRDFAQKRGMIFSIFRDPKGVEAKRLGASATPEVFLLDREGKLVYHGGLESHDAIAAFDYAVRGVLQGEPAPKSGGSAERTPIDMTPMATSPSSRPVLATYKPRTVSAMWRHASPAGSRTLPATQRTGKARKAAIPTESAAAPILTV